MPNEIRTFTKERLEAVVADLGQPRFRAKQLYEWLHGHRVSSYSQMTNLPKALREKLEERFPLFEPTVLDKRISADATRKYVLKLHDGALVEAVGMPSFSDDGEVKRLTVCFSTQVGCAMACAFCATGGEGFTRNLTATEMVDQIVAVERDFGHRVTNAVAMGQGEPFLNYAELLSALRMLNDPAGLNIGARHITVSTCGIIDGIRRLSDEPEQFTLAISLHAAVQGKRDALMPRMENQPLVELRRALDAYTGKTGRRVSLEYLLIDGVNDAEEDLDALIGFCEGLLCHVNLLPVNAVEGSAFAPSAPEVVAAWIKRLSRCGVETTMRNSRGKDIEGACGQLKNAYAKQG